MNGLKRCTMCGFFYEGRSCPCCHIEPLRGDGLRPPTTPNIKNMENDIWTEKQFKNI